MKPYDELTTRGKLRRLRSLSLKALEEYHLQVKRLKFLAIETNTMFRVDAEDGERYVLRIYSDEETTLRDNLAEMFWLNALRRDTDLNVTEPVVRRDGGYVTVVNAPGVPGERRCALFRWIPGRCLVYYLSPEKYYQLGRIMAKLHDHAESLELPADIQPKRWERVFYYPDEPVVYSSAEYRHLFSSEQITVLDEVVRRADRLFEDLYADERGRILIHGDLHFWNVHVYRGELYMMDFEDVMLGYPVQDVAITLYYGRDREDYDALCGAFSEGYTSLRQWPVERSGQLETLMAARKAMFINYVARAGPSPQEFVEEGCKILRHFLEAYD
jgi:Ser/Thr protein kinase RdoA (MazF antagonist)